MILRCQAPRKKDRLRPCGWWLATVPDGHKIVRVIQHSSEAHPDNLVVGCGECRALHEIARTLREAA